MSDGALLPLRGAAADPLAVLVHSQFRGLMLSPAFPCLGGAGAVRRGDYRFGIYGALGSAAAIQACAADLARHIAACPAAEHPVAVFVACFAGAPPTTEGAFEAALWRHLYGLDGLQPAPTLPAAMDPEDPGFFYGDREYFVVGLHPVASRWARRFGWPTLVFNALSHAEELRRTGKDQGMKAKILARDRRLQGLDNPSLPHAQRAQFSGRSVDAAWHCPRRPPP